MLCKLATLACVSVTASLGFLINAGAANAGTFSVTVEGTDAIYLSGRTDVTIPNLGGFSPTFPLGRHGFVAADFLKETFPQAIGATGGQKFSFAASGCVNYYNGIGCPNNGFGPEGSGFSNISSLGGISGYRGPSGALVGVFLNNSIPLGGAPAALNYGAIGTSLASLAPALGQVFFIGDGLTGTGSGSVQEFIAPTGATRLFLGLADGFGFAGSPGAYEDNDGRFTVRVTTPEPTAIAGLALISGIAVASRRRKVAKA
ncbi:MAG TPA: PEP-CTERM sorting domain-containing protein [Nostocaceae cyanobacterium]|nr:PEP-CTERM sorting domain-containing protein [Nostocaceae cyanobacterium]